MKKKRKEEEKELTNFSSFIIYMFWVIVISGLLILVASCNKDPDKKGIQSNDRLLYTLRLKSTMCSLYIK